MKLLPASAVLCTALFTTVFAGHPAFPVSSDGYQSIFMGITTESDERYINKSITDMNSDLRMIAMGNTGLTSYLTNGPGPFGWNEEKGVLAQKRTIVDGSSLNWQDLQYEWIPMQFRVQTDHWGGPENLPSTGLAAPYFPPYRFNGGVKMRNDGIEGPSFDPPRLYSSEHNYIGVKDENGKVISKWYACDDGKYASALSWSLDDTAAKDPTCVLVKLRKVNNRMELAPVTSSAGATDPFPAPSSPSRPGRPAQPSGTFLPPGSLQQTVSNRGVTRSPISLVSAISAILPLLIYA